MASPSDEASLLLSTTGGDAPTPLTSAPRRPHLRRPFCLPRPTPALAAPASTATAPIAPPRRPQLDDDLSDEVELLSDSDES